MFKNLTLAYFFYSLWMGEIRTFSPVSGACRNRRLSQIGDTGLGWLLPKFLFLQVVFPSAERRIKKLYESKYKRQEIWKGNDEEKIMIGDPNRNSTLITFLFSWPRKIVVAGAPVDMQTIMTSERLLIKIVGIFECQK